LTKGYLQRRAAWEVLLNVSSGLFSDKALEKVLKNYNLTSLDVAFITELSFGCIRYRKYLDLWIDHTSKLKHQKQPPKLRWLLHIGLYQILKMDRIPFSASISTTVEVAKKTDLKGLSGVVNGILRNVIRKLESKSFPIVPKNRIEKIASYESLPVWLIHEITKWVGSNEAEMIAKSFNKKPSIDLRVNTRQTNIEEILGILQNNDIEAEPITELMSGIELRSKPRSVVELPGYSEGKWVIQNRSSQWVAPLLKPKKGEKILDACSAPGSKTGHLADLISDDGEIWSIDRSEIRMKILRENLKRLKIKSVKNYKCDATKLFEIKPELKNYFDKILLDAPCSGIGTFSRNPDARWTLTPQRITQLIGLQNKLLNNLVPLLNKKGTLVYSTCTICPHENNFLIENFLRQYPDLYLVSERQILPSLDHHWDGFYAAVIKYK
tara:strand:- start:5292 stop:6605 length:1314 start_codon:yes stop_codon:yes gene_type:complete